MTPEQQKALALSAARRRAAMQQHGGPTKAAAAELPNQDGTYGEVPPGMVFDPSTGGYMDATLPHNRMYGDGAGQALAHGTGQGVSFGTMDEAVGALHGMIGPNSYVEDYAFGRDRMRAELEAAREENPVAAYGGEIAGALAVPGAALRLAKGGTPLARMGKGAAVAGAEGGIYGFGAGEGGVEERGENALLTGGLSAFVGGGAPVVANRAKRAIDGMFRKNAERAMAKTAPSTEALRAQGQAAYKAIDDAGVQIKPQAFDGARKQILEALRGKTGFDELPGPGSLTPNTARVAQIMEGASQKMAGDPTAALPFRSLDQMRRQAGAAAGNVTNKGDQQAGMQVIEGLDDFVQHLGPDDVVAGDVEALKNAIPKAREVWGRMSRSQLVDDAIQAGENYVSGGSSGVRNQFAKILRNPKLTRGFSEAELSAMRRVVNGSAPERILNLLGGGLGQLGQVGLGGATGGVPGALMGAVTAAATRKGSEAVSRKNAEVVRALVAAGGKVPAKQLPDNTRLLIEGLVRRGARGVEVAR